ncbi:MAG: DedA family protein [Desulfobacteraceae bacterium]|nr:MAG: DedA family protein [Desulfobacteraceae bacterium]
MTYTETYLDLLRSVPDPAAYLFLAVSSFVENVFPPIPGDTITAFGAFLVGIGKLSFLGVYASTTLGSIGGFLSLYKMGGWLGRRFFMENDYRFFRASSILKAEQWFEKYGYFVIGMNRFLPGVRSAVALAGGICRLKAHWVALLALLSSATWNLIWILTGYLLGNNWELVESRLSAILLRFNTAVATLLVVIVLFAVWNYRRRKKKTG